MEVFFTLIACLPGAAAIWIVFFIVLGSVTHGPRGSAASSLPKGDDQRLDGENA